MPSGLRVSDVKIKYLLFDVESVADGSLISRVKYPGENLSPEEAVAKFRAALMEKFDSDFIPYTFQVPVSINVAKVDANFQLVDLVALDEPNFRPHVVTKQFWKGWEYYNYPTLVTFNGRGFDLPLMELAAFRFGLSVGRWFDTERPNYEQPRYRYATRWHLDLQDILSNFGAVRINGGLNLAANLLGKPGKMDVEGYMVQDMYDEGRVAEINDYCRCDVLDTYFVFLRCQVVLGRIALHEEQAIVQKAREWIEDHTAEYPALGTYLSNWGKWENPWGDDMPPSQPELFE
jgi:predicted PolB exonuclease-like 3'-5' exonuclease